MKIWMNIIVISLLLGWIPLAYRIWKRKTRDNISIILWVVMLHGLIWALYYGVTVSSIILIITNSVCITLDSIVLITIIKYRIKSIKQRMED